MCGNSVTLHHPEIIMQGPAAFSLGWMSLRGVGGTFRAWLSCVVASFPLCGKSVDSVRRRRGQLRMRWLDGSPNLWTWIWASFQSWHSTPVLLPGKSHGWRSLVGCSPWGLEESDMTEWLHFHFSLSCIGEGNGNPLQCSCLENPRDGGAWWAAIYGVAQSRTRLKRLSSSSSREAWSAAVHGVAKSRTWLSNWTERTLLGSCAASNKAHTFQTVPPPQTLSIKARLSPQFPFFPRSSSILSRWWWGGFCLSLVRSPLRAVCMSIAQSCLTLCNPMDCSPPVSSVRGISQARILEWFAISFSKGSSPPRHETLVSWVSCIGRQVLYH